MRPAPPAPLLAIVVTLLLPSLTTLTLSPLVTMSVLMASLTLRPFYVGPAPLIVAPVTPLPLPALPVTLLALSPISTLAIALLSVLTPPTLLITSVWLALLPV